MQFGPVPLDQAEGAILAHSVPLPNGRLRKGCRIGPEEIATLRGIGLSEVIVARLDPQDVHEDAAALTIAEALIAGQAAGLDLRPVGTGRVNIHAAEAGVVGVDAARVNALNAVDPMITLATVPRWQRLAAGRDGGDGQGHRLWRGQCLRCGGGACGAGGAHAPSPALADRRADPDRDARR